LGLDKIRIVWYTIKWGSRQSATLSVIIRGRADIESIIYSDGWRSYNGLVDLGYEKHFRVNYGENEF
jgi:transposase-like protein